jgi:hypothetical protein
MFILRPSSAFKSERSGSDPVIKAAPSIGGPVDEGSSLPAEYDVDIVRAMLQDPFRVFVYWEVREESLKALTRYFSPDEVAGFKVVLKLIEMTGPNEAFFEVERRGRYWLMVFPDREYEFEIGIRSPVHGYISLVRSNRVRTPRGTVSPEPPSEDDYRLTPSDLMAVIDASGFGAEQSLSLKVAGGRGDDVAPDFLSSLLNELPDAVRSAIMIAATGGSLTAEMIASFPEPLRSELLRLFSATGGRVTAAGLMHYLPELLRTVMESDQEWFGDQIRPIHIAPRFFVGGTENLSWPAGELRWPGLPRRPSSAEIYI